MALERAPAFVVCSRSPGADEGSHRRRPLLSLASRSEFDQKRVSMARDLVLTTVTILASLPCRRGRRLPPSLPRLTSARNTGCRLRPSLSGAPRPRPGLEANLSACPAGPRRRTRRQRSASWRSVGVRSGPDGRRASQVAIDPHSVSAARTIETLGIATGWCDRSRLRHRPTRASSHGNSSSRPLARLAGVGRGDPAPPCPGQTGRPWRPRPSYPPPSHRPAAERWFDGRALGPRGRLRPRAASPSDFSLRTALGDRQGPPEGEP